MTLISLTEQNTIEIFASIPKGVFGTIDLGWNLRMTSIQAALGLAQIESINQTMSRKRDIGLRYQKNLESNSNLQMPLDKTSYAMNCYWVFGVLVKKVSGVARRVSSFSKR